MQCVTADITVAYRPAGKNSRSIHYSGKMVKMVVKLIEIC